MAPPQLRRAAGSVCVCDDIHARSSAAQSVGNAKGKSLGLAVSRNSRAPFDLVMSA